MGIVESLPVPAPSAELCVGDGVGVLASIMLELPWLAEVMLKPSESKDPIPFPASFSIVNQNAELSVRSDDPISTVHTRLGGDSLFPKSLRLASSN